MTPNPPNEQLAAIEKQLRRSNEHLQKISDNVGCLYYVGIIALAVMAISAIGIFLRLG